MKVRKTMPMIKMIVIELEDRGQGFTELYVDGNNFVIAARRVHSSLAPELEVWNGHRIANRVIRRGTLLRLIKGDKEIVVKSPIVKITHSRTIAT
jgi:hypothetical protein